MHGLYILWWVQVRHVPAAAVAAAMAAGDLGLTFFEIPTGWLADRCGHRVSLIVGSILQTGGMALCWFSAFASGFASVLAAALLVALGDAFRSGADQALLYRSCVALGRASDFQKIEARSRALQLAALVVLTLAGGALVNTWGFAVGWSAEIALSAIGLAIALLMVEPPAAIADSSEDDGAEVKPGATGEAARDPVAAVILPAAAIGAIASTGVFLAQAAGTDPGAMTMLVAGATLAEAAGAVVASHLSSGRRQRLALTAAAALASIAAAIDPAAFLPAIVALSFLVGIAGPLRAAAIQRIAADSTRARAASIASACDKALTAVALLLAGMGVPHVVRRRLRP